MSSEMKVRSSDWDQKMIPKSIRFVNINLAKNFIIEALL